MPIRFEANAQERVALSIFDAVLECILNENNQQQRGDQSCTILYFFFKLQIQGSPRPYFLQSEIVIQIFNFHLQYG